ncbi:MAG: sugar ABC transporter ATP-binding protein, partial [Planctomycetes bacterium]|nr:sugar ABC transporter ATP-binding protein [Planctomycetota bacterium]
DQGKSIIYISHRLEELFKVADRVSVLKDGNLVGTRDLVDLTHDDIVQMMVGREIDKYTRQKRSSEVDKTAEVILEVRGLTSGDVFKDVSFSLHAGEVLGFSGLVGAGRTEVMEAIYGLRRIDSGEILINSKPARIRRPNDSIRHGIGMTSEDRKNKSLFLNFNVRQNVTVSQLKALFPAPYVSAKSERRFVERFIDMLNMRPPDPEMKAINMSGGNQQKVVIAKCLATTPDILIMDEPTRGIDVGAKAEIYAIIHRLAGEGKGIIVVSSDLPEILSISDRIIVMNKGRIYADVPCEEATEENIMAHCCAP